MGVYTDMDLDDLIKENLRLTRENNKLLKKMRRDAIIGRFVKLALLMVIIAMPFVLYYYFIAPYVAEMRQTYAEIQGNLETVESLREQFPSFPEWLSQVFSGKSPAPHGTTSTSTIR